MQLNLDTNNSMYRTLVLLLLAKLNIVLNLTATKNKNLSVMLNIVTLPKMFFRK